MMNSLVDRSSSCQRDTNTQPAPDIMKAGALAITSSDVTVFQDYHDKNGAQPASLRDQLSLVMSSMVTITSPILGT